MDSAYALSRLRTAELKKLRSVHRSINALCILWIIGCVMLLPLIPAFSLSAALSTNQTPGELAGKIAMIVFLVPFLAFQIATVIGCYKRTEWGRICGMIASGLSLLGFPLGTLIGILGLLAFIQNPQLFGPDRLDGREITAEYLRRIRSRS